MHEVREALPPTIFFFVGFNFVVFTTNLLVAEYAVAVSNFMLATVAALVVDKAVLVANAMPVLGRYDRADPADPVQDGFLLGHRVLRSPAGALRALLYHRAQSAGRFLSVSDYDLLVASLFCDLPVDPSPVPDLCDRIGIQPPFRPGELRRLFFTSRPSELQLNRRQRIREFLRLSRLMDMHPVGEFRDPMSPAHGQLIEILQRLAR